MICKINPKLRYLAIGLALLAALATGLLWQSFDIWNRNSKAQLIVKQADISQQYVIELSNSEAAITDFLLGKVSDDVVTERISILASKGDLLLEDTAVSRAMKSTAWTYSTAQKLASISKESYYISKAEPLTSKEALEIRDRLVRNHSLAIEFNNRMQAKDIEFLNANIDRQQYLQKLLALSLLGMALTGLILITSMWKYASNSLKYAEIAEAAQKHAEFMRAKAEEETDLISRISSEWITYTRLQTNRLDLTPSIINVYDLIVKSCKTQPKVLSDRIKGTKINADADKLGQCIRALASLAEYRGSPEVILSRDDTYVYIEIHDEGFPIEHPIEEICVMGEKARMAGDFGVGLEVVYKVIKEMRGDLSHRNKENGNVFTLKVPINA